MRVFFALENRLGFSSVLGTVLGRFGEPKWVPKIAVHPPPNGFQMAIKIYLFLDRSQEASRRLQEGPKSHPRGPRRPPRAAQEAPKAPQEGPRAPQEAKRSPQSLPRAHQLSQNCFPQIACRKRRAGGGDPPWGRQSAATRRVGACLDSFRNLLRILRQRALVARTTHAKKRIN